MIPVAEMSFKNDLKQLIKPYYLINIALSLSYVVLKRLPGICNYLFNVEECEFEGVSEKVRLRFCELFKIISFTARIRNTILSHDCNHDSN